MPWRWDLCLRGRGWQTQHLSLCLLTCLDDAQPAVSTACCDIAAPWGPTAPAIAGQRRARHLNHLNDALGRGQRRRPLAVCTLQRGRVYLLRVISVTVGIAERRQISVNP
jgi:hypothetical protein